MEGTPGVVQGWGTLSSARCSSQWSSTGLMAKRKRSRRRSTPGTSSSPQSTCWKRVLSKESLQVAQATRLDQQSHGWALLNSDPASVKVISSYKGLQADQDKNAKLFQLRGRVAVSLQALAEVLPSYSDKDFHVVARQNNKGIWCSELWTKKIF